MKLVPDFQFERIDRIDPGFFARQNIRLVALDVDNTLTTHDNPEPDARVLEWLAKMKQEGIKLAVLSNNKEERVAPFAARLGLGHQSRAGKPLTGGLKRLAQRYRLPPEQIALIGDQIFTDIWCANRFGAVSILVEPMYLEDMPFFKLKRRLERLVLGRPRGGEHP